MTMQITAGQVFPSGRTAPRGLYRSVQTGVWHRQPRAARLPEGGPFELVASTDLVVVEEAAPLFRWAPADEQPAEQDTPSPWWTMFATYRITRAGWGLF